MDNSAKLNHAEKHDLAQKLTSATTEVTTLQGFLEDVTAQLNQATVEKKQVAERLHEAQDLVVVLREQLTEKEEIILTMDTQRKNLERKEQQVNEMNKKLQNMVPPKSNGFETFFLSTQFITDYRS